MVVVGLHPNCDIQALHRQYIARKSEGSGKLRSALNYQNYSRVEPNLEPQVGILVYKMLKFVVLICENVLSIGFALCFYFQVLFAYPREKQLPLKYKDLLSFCFPGGVEVGYILDYFYYI